MQKVSRNTSRWEHCINSPLYSTNLSHFSIKHRVGYTEQLFCSTTQSFLGSDFCKRSLTASVDGGEYHVSYYTIQCMKPVQIFVTVIIAFISCFFPAFPPLLISNLFENSFFLIFLWSLISSMFCLEIVFFFSVLQNAFLLFCKLVEVPFTSLKAFLFHLMLLHFFFSFVLFHYTHK